MFFSVLFMLLLEHVLGLQDDISTIMLLLLLVLILVLLLLLLPPQHPVSPAHPGRLRL